MHQYQEGDILYDASYGFTVALIEKFNNNGKPRWKVLVVSNSKGYDDSKVGEIVLVGEKYLDSWYVPIDKANLKEDDNA